jgi:hypothetical protein
MPMVISNDHGQRFLYLLASFASCPYSNCRSDLTCACRDRTDRHFPTLSLTSLRRTSSGISLCAGIRYQSEK